MIAFCSDPASRPFEMLLKGLDWVKFRRYFNTSPEPAIFVLGEGKNCRRCFRIAGKGAVRRLNATGNSRDIMLETLSNKLQKILRDLTGQGRVSERHVEETTREIRNALLDADVHFKIAKEFVERVKQRALGQEVMQSLTPGQQVVKVVRDELVELLGGSQTELRFASQPPSVYLMVGLQGSGKTTTTTKLGRWLSRNNHVPLLLSVDVYRPAAVEQLRVLCADHETFLGIQITSTLNQASTGNSFYEGP